MDCSPVNPRRLIRRSLLLTTALAFAATGCGSLDKDAVSTKLGEASSAAEEGALLAHQDATGATAVPFVAIHSVELHKVAGNAAEALSGSVGDPYRPAAHEGSGLARRVEAQLQDLHLSPDDPTTAARVETKLLALASQLSDLESKL